MKELLTKIEVHLNYLEQTDSLGIQTASIFRQVIDEHPTTEQQFLNTLKRHNILDGITNTDNEHYEKRAKQFTLIMIKVQKYYDELDNAFNWTMKSIDKE